MNLTAWLPIVIVMCALCAASPIERNFMDQNSYMDLYSEFEDNPQLNSEFVDENKYYPRAAVVKDEATATTECEPVTTEAPAGGAPATTASTGGGGGASGGGGGSSSGGASAPSSGSSSGSSTADGNDAKTKELQALVQHLYVAQARVQLEANEIKKAQAVANSAQLALEEATNHVRTVSAALQTAQESVAAAAIRAQTSQLQLAAHDQLLFAARQDVDALSSQMVGLQAAEGILGPKMAFDLNALMEKLKQPLADSAKPTAVTPIVPIPPQFSKGGKSERDTALEELYYD